MKKILVYFIFIAFISINPCYSIAVMQGGSGVDYSYSKAREEKNNSGYYPSYPSRYYYEYDRPSSHFYYRDYDRRYGYPPPPPPPGNTFTGYNNNSKTSSSEMTIICVNKKTNKTVDCSTMKSNSKNFICLDKTTNETVKCPK